MLGVKWSEAVQVSGFAWELPHSSIEALMNSGLVSKEMAGDM